MIRTILSHLALPVIVAAVMTLGPTEAFAQHGGGHGGGGGFHGGGGRGGAYQGGVHYGGFGGYSNYRGYGYRSYGGYRYRPFYGYGYYPYYPSYGYGSYPYYGTYPSYSDFSTPDVVTIPDSGPNTTVPSTPAAPTDSAVGNSSTPSSPSGVTTSADSPTRITVRLPGDADLWFNGTKMTATGPVRVFSHPPVTPGRQYSYTIRAHWIDNGTTTDQTRTVFFTPGDNLDVSFPTPSSTGEKATGMIAP